MAELLTVLSLSYWLCDDGCFCKASSDWRIIRRLVPVPKEDGKSKPLAPRIMQAWSQCEVTPLTPRPPTGIVLKHDPWSAGSNRD